MQNPKRRAGRDAVPVASAASSLRLPTLDEFLAQEFPARPLLLAPWLRQGDAALVFAKTGVGKSMLVTSIALAVASGGSVLGWQAPAPARVLYVDGEMAARDMQARFRMLATAVDGGDREAAGRNLVPLSKLAHEGHQPFPDIATLDGRGEVVAAAQRTQAALVVLDNLGCLADIDDWNDAAGCRPIADFVRTLSKANVALLAVHHEGKSNSRTPRGTSALEEPMAISLRLERAGRTCSQSAFRLQWRKDRHAAGPPETLVALVDGRWQAEEGDNGGGGDFDALVAAARDPRNRTQADVARALGCAKSTVTERKRQAIAAGVFTEAEWAEWLPSLRGHKRPA